MFSPVSSVWLSDEFRLYIHRLTTSDHHELGHHNPGGVSGISLSVEIIAVEREHRGKAGSQLTIDYIWISVPHHMLLGSVLRVFGRTNEQIINFVRVGLPRCHVSRRSLDDFVQS